MSLQSLLEPLKTLKKYTWDIPDQQIQGVYTKPGQKIPKKHLYLGSIGANYIGTASANFLIYYYFGPDAFTAMAIPATFFLAAPDHVLSWRGLEGTLNVKVEGESKSIDFEQRFCESYNQGIRWPVLLTGAGFVGKSAYDVIKCIMNGEPLTGETSWNLTTGLGLLGLASSMYLKDQDSNLLKKENSKVKALFAKLKGAYVNAKDKAKEMLPTPSPIPQPVPVQAYATLDIRV